MREGEGGGCMHGEVIRRRGKMEEMVGSRRGVAEVKWGGRRELFRLDSHMTHNSHELKVFLVLQEHPAIKYRHSTNAFLST